MDIIDDAGFRKQLRTTPAAGYFFFGSEDYLKSHALRAARDTLCPDEALAPFNNPRLDGGDADSSIASLPGVLSTLPVMAEKKLVEVTGLDINSLKPNQLDALVSATELLSEYDYNTLIISVAAGCVDEGYLPRRPSATLKKLGQNLTPVNFTSPTPAMLARWTAKHFEHNGATASPAVCASLTEYCGNDMFTLAAEVDKVSWYVLSHNRQEVTVDDIKAAAIPDTGYDAFAFANAISDRKRSEALGILAEMQRRRIEPTIIMGEIIRTFCDMISVKLLADSGLRPQEISAKLGIHEYKVSRLLRPGTDILKLRKILALCTDTDAALKLSPQGYTAIERLICSL